MGEREVPEEAAGVAVKPPPHPTSRRRKSEKTRSDTGRAPKISEYQSGADRNRMRKSFDDSAAEK